jgi:hypothetical protein
MPYTIQNCGGRLPWCVFLGERFVAAFPNRERATQYAGV